MNNKKVFFEYFKTVALAILAAAIIVSSTFVIIQKNVYKEQKRQEAQNEEIDYFLVSMLIEKNKYLEQQDPKNFKINMRLGVLFSLKRDFKTAEIEYKKAIQKAPYGEYRPHYKLAGMYIMLERFDDAEELIDNIIDRPNPAVIGYKAEIYNLLGDKYYSKGDYEDAISRYQKSIFYYKTINPTEEKKVKKSLISAYVYLADEKINNLEFDDAIALLNLAKGIMDAPIIKYKLALLLTKDSPLQAYKYFDEVFKEEPAIINYETYFNFLTALILEAQEQGNTAQAELYKYKIKKLKEFSQANILSVRDIAIEDMKGKITYNWIMQRYDVRYQFKIKNTAFQPINSLYLDVTFSEKDKVIQKFSDYFITSKTPLKSGEISPEIVLKTTIAKNELENSPKTVSIQVFASKNKEAYRILLGDIKIKERIKSNKIMKLFGL